MTQRFAYRRGALTTFINRHIVAWEVFFGALAVGYLVLEARFDSGGKSVPIAILLTFSVVFFLEFVGRFMDAADRKRYVKQHGLDLLSAIPFISGIRLLRLLRLLRLVRIHSGLQATTNTEDVLDTSTAAFLVPTLIVIWFGAGCAFWSVEHGTNPALHSFGDALYWSFITATTLGYGVDLTAVTMPGKLLTGTLIFLSIGVFGYASAWLTEIWLHDEELSEVLEEVKLLRTDIAELRALVFPPDLDVRPATAPDHEIERENELVAR